MSTTSPTTTVSLVLGSGGARGLAHIGVIQWLTENGYEIRSIAGSSMGALVGGIYAAGKLDVYARWVCALERSHVLRLLDPTLGRQGLFKGERVMGVLRELIGDRDIEQLSLCFTAVATDLQSGEEVWLRQGRLFDAIRASIATPLVFTPFAYGDRVLLDGALVNPLPVTPTMNDDTELTVAVHLGGPAEVRPPPAPSHVADNGNVYAQHIGRFISNLRLGRPAVGVTHSLLDVAFVSMQTMHDTITRLKLAAHAPDLVVEIPRNACGFHEFWRAEEMIALGRERAARAFAGMVQGVGLPSPATASASVSVDGESTPEDAAVRGAAARAQSNFRAGKMRAGHPDARVHPVSRGPEDLAGSVPQN